MRNYFSCLAILLFAGVRFGFGQDFLIEEDLRLDWVFYDEEQKVMLPFLDNSNENPVAIHLSINPDYYGKEAYLKTDIPSGTSLLINNKYIKRYLDKSTKYFLLDSLQGVYETSPLQYTLYRNEGFKNPPNAKVGFIHRTFDSAINVNPITERDKDTKEDFLKIIILVIFAFFVLLHALFPSDLLDFLSVSNLITFRYTDTAFTKYRSLTKTQTLVIIYQGGLLSGILMIFLNYYYNPLGQVFFLQINPLLGWLVMFVMLLVLIFLKFILISIISSLFGIPDRTNFYFVEFIRMGMMFYSAIFIIVSYIVINQIHILEALLESLMFSIVIFNLLRFLVLFFKFRRMVSMKSLHLFSYLCTTELIPIVLGLKFFLK